MPKPCPEKPIYPKDAKKNKEDLCWNRKGHWFDVVMNITDGTWHVLIDVKRVDSCFTRDEAEALIKKEARKMGIRLS